MRAGAAHTHTLFFRFSFLGRSSLPRRETSLTTHTQSARPGWRFGFWRWVWLALMILVGLMSFGVIGGGLWTPVSPTVALPAEPAWPGWYIIPEGLLPFLPEGLPL